MIEFVFRRPKNGTFNKRTNRAIQRSGFLLVKNLFDPTNDLDPIIHEYYGVLDDLVETLYSKGEIKSRYEDLSFSDKLMQIQTETGKVFHQHFDFSLPQGGITFDTPIWLGKAVFDILRNDKLLDAVESLIGPEIYANPVQHVRLKTPEALIPAHLKNNVKLTTTPWHQDNGVVTPDADATDMITSLVSVVGCADFCRAVEGRAAKSSRRIGRALSVTIIGRFDSREAARRHADAVAANEAR